MKSFWMLIFLMQRAGLYCHLNLLFVTLGLRLWKVLVRCPKKQNIHQYFDSLNIDVRSFSLSITLKLNVIYPHGCSCPFDIPDILFTNCLFYSQDYPNTRCMSVLSWWQCWSSTEGPSPPLHKVCSHSRVWQGLWQ